jgi:hypothetical protein
MEATFVPKPGETVIYKKPVEQRYSVIYTQQDIPCRVIKVYANGTASVQPLNLDVGRKVVKQKHLFRLSNWFHKMFVSLSAMKSNFVAAFVFPWKSFYDFFVRF